MVSYSIDASVYAFPFNKEILDHNDIINYLETISNLSEVIFEKQPRDKKYYLFLRDIELIDNCEDLNLIEQDISILDKILESTDTFFNIRNVQLCIEKIFNRLLPTTSEDSEDNEEDVDPLAKKIIFENWFHIEDIDFKPGKKLSLPDEMNKKRYNEKLLENTEKNMAKIAYLNKYVYKDENIHKLVLGCDIHAQSISITNTEFNIIMGNVPRSGGKTYIIKDAPRQNISIKNQSISTSTLETLVMSDPNCPKRKWETVLNDAEKDFKHLKIGPEVKANLEHYINTINVEKNKLPKYVKEIDKSIEECPSSIYENLKALNNFIPVVSLLPTRINTNEQHYCCTKCEFYFNCGSNIRFFGVDCCDESGGIKGDILAEADRKRKSSDGDYPIYWTHLRPRSKLCDDDLWFLTIRIHIRLLLKENKIEIGWIGRHLYHCPKEKYHFMGCKMHKECPFNPKSPLHDKNADKLTNYLKRWPKQEPVSPPPETEKAEKTEKSSENAPENQ
jgi:hypothetical protein